jgi:hypothetical protein
LAPAVAAVAVVAELLAVLELEAVRLPLLPVRLQVPVGRVLLSHKLLPLLRLQVAVVLPEVAVVLPEVAAAVELVQGLVASEILRRR